MQPVSVRNPRHFPGGVLLDATFPTGEEAEFFATPTDSMDYGIDLYDRAIAGEFGAVAPYIEPVPTEAQLIAGIQAAVTEHLDAAAMAKNYDNIQSAAIRAGFSGPFHDEGVAFATWMDACWAMCYQLLAEVKSGERPVMTAEEVVAELPALVLP